LGWISQILEKERRIYRHRDRATSCVWNNSFVFNDGISITHTKRLNVPAEFLAESGAAAIRVYLHRWDVAQLWRDADAKQVTVLKGEPPIKAEDFPGEIAT
jgi:hypothetical protein